MNKRSISIICATALFASVLAVPAYSAEILTADTSRPNMSTFAAGEPVQLTFQVSGLAPSSSTSLSIVIKDAHDNVVTTANLPVTSAADGTWSGTYNAPSDLLGFYRVFPTLADGVTVEKLFTRQPGYITYAVVPDPSKRIDYGDSQSIFGMQGGFNSTVNIIPYLGVRWVLGTFNWSTLEKDHPGQLAEEIAAAKARVQNYPIKNDATEGLSYHGRLWNTYVLACMNGVPDWASDPAMKAGNAPILPSAESAYQTYCETMAHDFCAMYPGQKQHVYQVTWEPVYPWGYKGTDSQLVRTYELAYPSLHKADPNAIVVGPTGGGISDTDSTWALGLFKAGIGKYIDGFAIHPYFSLPPEPAGLVDQIQRLKDMIRTYTGKDLPIYGTEQGFATKDDVSKELLQAEGLTREYLIMAGEGLKFNFAFYIADYPGEPGYGFYYNLEPGVNWGTNKIGPKPIAPAYAAMTYLLDGHHATQRIDWLGPQTLGYSFARGGSVVLALWSYGDTPRQVTVPVGGDSVTVYDWMGNAHSVSAPGGSLSTILTSDPIYITGVSPKMWGQNPVKSLAAVTHHVGAFPGQSVSIAAVVDGVGGRIDGTLSLTADNRLGVAPIVKQISVRKGVRENITYLMTLPADTDQGDYAATLLLKGKDGRAIMGDGVLIDVKSPMSISGVVPIVGASKHSLSITLANALAKPLNGTISTRLIGVPEGRQSASFTLAPMQSRTINLPNIVADLTPEKVYSADIKLRTSAGFLLTQSFPVDFMVAPKLKSPPAIDGSMTGWEDVPAAMLTGRESVVRRPDLWKGDDDLSASVKYAWDDTALYLAVDATDDIFYQDKTGYNTWFGDSVQIGFDIDNGKAIVSTGNELEDQKSAHRWSELTLALTKNGPEVYRSGSYNTDLFPVAGVPLSSLPLAVVRKGVHTYYEASIPWTLLGKTDAPIPGERIGVALSVNDVDFAAQTEPKAVGLFGGMNGHKEMNDYGVLSLDGPR